MVGAKSLTIAGTDSFEGEKPIKRMGGGGLGRGSLFGVIGDAGTLDKVVSIIYSGRTYLKDKYLRALSLSRQQPLRLSRRSS
jgi:hypothetical protein